MKRFVKLTRGASTVTLSSVIALSNVVMVSADDNANNTNGSSGVVSKGNLVNEGVTENQNLVFDGVGKAEPSETGEVVNENGVITIKPSNGKIDSSSTDIYPFYNIEVSDKDSFTIEVDMKTIGVNTGEEGKNSVSNQSYAGILYRDYISTEQGDRPAIIGTGVVGQSASTVSTRNFSREGLNGGAVTLETPPNSKAEDITSNTTHKLRLDKFGNNIRVSVDGYETINTTILDTFGNDKDNAETSNIGLFSARNLITEFSNLEITEYKVGDFKITPPKDTKYIQNFETKFKTDGLVVTLDGKNVPLSECIITGFDVSTTGKKTITVSYGANKATFDINVEAPTATSLNFVYKPVKSTYFKGQELDLTGLEIKTIYNNNPSYTSTHRFDDADFNDIFKASTLDTNSVTGNTDVTISLKNSPNVKTKFTVDVKDFALTGLDITQPAQKVYYVGDGTDGKIALNTKGITVRAVYTKPGSQEVYKEIVELDDANLTIGSVNTTSEQTGQKVEVSYRGVVGSVPVDVVAVKPIKAEIKEYPETTYDLNNKFDTKGLEVVLVNNDGTTQQLVLGTDYTVDTTSIDNSKEGTYTAKIKINDKYDIESKELPFKVTYRAPFTPVWEGTIFGQSTTLTDGKCAVDVNGNIMKDGTVRVASLDGAGKITGAHDGIAYYYFELDPTKDNFKISADVQVNAYSKDVSGSTQKHDGQESFGIMVRDDNTEKGNTASFSSNVAAVGGYSGGTTLQNGIQGFVRTGVDPSDAESEIKMQVERLTTERGFEMVGKTYNLTLEKDNTGFLMSVDGSEPVRIYSDLDTLAKLNKEKMYVGFYAARVADITVSNVDLTVTAVESDPAQVLKPEVPVTPAIKVNSLSKFGNKDYNFKFTPNVDGIVTVTQNGNTIAKEQEVKKGVEVSIPSTLVKGDNNFAVEYWPDTTMNITSAAKVLTQYTVDNKVLGSGDKVYVAVDGKATNSGEINSPVNIQTALDYASAGQTIYLKGGVYNFTKELVAPKDVNGTKDKNIVVRPLDENGEDVVFDFNDKGAGLRISGDYWHFYKVNVTGSAANSNGIVLSGNHNILESSSAYKNGNTGIQISALTGSAPRETWPTYNKVINCTSYENRDPSANNADGFAAKITTGKGNEFIGCIAYANADDGWDLYSKTESGAIEPVTLTNCVAYGNGYIDGKLTGGDMNGFKLGGEGLAVDHTIVNSLAFNNGANGFDSNSNPNVIANNNVSYDNESANFNFTTYATVGPNFRVNNFISYYTTDYAQKTSDVYSKNQANLLDTFNGTTYYYIDDVNANSKGDVYTDANFEALGVPTEIVRTGDAFGATSSNIDFGDLWKNFNEFFATTQK